MTWSSRVRRYTKWFFVDGNLHKIKLLTLQNLTTKNSINLLVNKLSVLFYKDRYLNYGVGVVTCLLVLVS